ncbi:MAG: hypothetical protein EOR00_22220 [Mesorhizobium sp.]|uniref:hypothetical protein n=1 Tax=Mesorhizobium sp. TaxID=1871066 RepID=UPI000FE60B73|nr:hypothetical protein [Mesorhizobium sp.]RWP14927.1 MAG: hypothetical protein EOR00_22220 [Mesorhizobium sp.]
MNKFVVASAMIIAASTNALAMTTLEKGYIEDNNKAFYIRVLNNNCHFKPAAEANAMTDDVGKFAKTVLGEDRFMRYAASAESRRIIGKFMKLDSYLASLSKRELKVTCSQHKKEYMKIYNYLVTQSDESGESEDK